MSYNTAKLIDNNAVFPNWLAQDKFWYTIKTAKGTKTYLVDPGKKTKTETSTYQDADPPKMS